MFSSSIIEDNNWGGNFLPDIPTTNVNGILTGTYKIGVDSLNDPAEWCKSTDITYNWKCGNGTEYSGKTNYVKDASATIIKLDCSTSYNKCDTVDLSLTDNGVLIMKRGNTKLWESHTAANFPIPEINKGEYKSSLVFHPNSDNADNLGKLQPDGKKSTVSSVSYNKISSGIYTNVWGENKWISSPTGICRLIQKDGVLKLQADKKICSVSITELSNNTIIPNNIGKIAYITPIGRKREWDNTVQPRYSSSFLPSLHNDAIFTGVAPTSSSSNPNPGMTIVPAGVLTPLNGGDDTCESRCKTDTGCGGYQIDGSKNCYILNDEALRNNNKDKWVKSDPTINLYFRLKHMNNVHPSCPNDISSNKIFMVSNSDWNSYRNSLSSPGTRNTSCGLDDTENVGLNIQEPFTTSSSAFTNENLDILKAKLAENETDYNIRKMNWDLSNNTVYSKLLMLNQKMSNIKNWNNDEIIRLKHINETSSFHTSSVTYKYYIWRTIALVVLAVTIIFWVKKTLKSDN